jgi:transcriptional regulator with XRE-family HTH domain
MDRQELLFSMAKKLEVSSSFLSGVENGKIPIPTDWPEKITSLYQLNRFESEELRRRANL